MLLKIDGYSLEETFFSNVGGQHTEYCIRRLQSTFTVDGFVASMNAPDAALLYERLSKIYYYVSSRGIWDETEYENRTCLIDHIGVRTLDFNRVRRQFGIET